jgi:hypothetical protein
VGELDDCCTGVDVSLRFVSICVVDRGGGREAKVDTYVDVIIEWLRALRPKLKTVAAAFARASIRI